MVEGLVEGPTLMRQIAQRGDARLQPSGAKSGQRRFGRGAGQANDGDGPPARRGGEGEDGAHVSSLSRSEGEAARRDSGVTEGFPTADADGTPPPLRGPPPHAVGRKRALTA